MQAAENKLSLPRPRELLVRLAVLVAASYGMFAFSYKYFVPSLGGWGDSRAYYALYQAPLDFHAGIAPFVLRQLSVVLTWLAWKAHLFHPGVIAFADPSYDQHIFFAALLVNWVALLGAALVAGLIAEELLGARDRPTAVLAGFFCLLSFQAQLDVMTDLAEGPGWLLLALAVLALLRHARVWLAVVLALAIFERELVLVAIACLAATQLVPLHGESLKALVHKRRMPLYALAASLAGALVYVAIRHRVVGYASQLQATPLLGGLLGVAFNRALFFQVFLAQNIVLLAIVPALFGASGLPRVRYWMPRALAAFFVVILVALAASAGNNGGRLAAILTPFFAAFAALWLTQRQKPTGHHANPTRAVLFGFTLLFLIMHFVGYFTPLPTPPSSRDKHRQGSPGPGQQSFVPLK